LFAARNLRVTAAGATSSKRSGSTVISKWSSQPLFALIWLMTLVVVVWIQTYWIAPESTL